MTAEALASLKAGVCTISALVSGLGAVFVAEASAVPNPLMSPGVIITGMIVTALAPVIAVVVLRLKTAAELKEIHTAVNSLSTAKDTKIEAQDKKIETMNALILLLTGEKMMQAQQIVAHEKTDIQVAAAKDAALAHATAQAEEKAKSQ